jgi:S-adenosylmethionine synthetase
MINTFGTSRISPDRIAEIVRKNFDLRPKAMIEYLDLLRPIYKKTAVYGHFGRSDPDFTWERTDKTKLLKSEAGI